MNLYKLSQVVNNDFDTFDSCIVCAPDEETAKRIHPAKWKDPARTWWLEDDLYTSWAPRLEDVQVELIGQARDGLEPGVILASFNAG